MGRLGPNLAGRFLRQGVPRLTVASVHRVAAHAFSIEVDAFSGSEKVITFSPGFAYTEAPSVTYEGVKFESKGSGSGTIGQKGDWYVGGFFGFSSLAPYSGENVYSDYFGNSKIIMTLSQGQIRRFGAAFSSQPKTTWKVTAFNSANVEIDSVTKSMPSPNSFVFIGLETSQDIAYVTVTEPNGENGNKTLMDDVRFEPVPEPASFLALGAGFFAMARKRRSK